MLNQQYVSAQRDHLSCCPPTTSSEQLFLGLIPSSPITDRGG